MKPDGRPDSLAASPYHEAKMDSFVLKHKLALYVIALAFALALRFANLSSPSLSDGEAVSAFTALHLARAQAQAGTISTSPLYAVLTAILFFVAGPSSLLARLWPAVAGSALVLLPLGMNKAFTRTEAVVSAFLLAVSPGLTALSRQAGGATLALFPVGVLLLLAAEGRLAKRSGMAGLSAGVALACGADGLTGLLLLGFGVGVVFLRYRGTSGGLGREGSLWEDVSGLLRSPRFWVSAGLSFPIAMTGLLFPSGLGVFATGVQRWAEGFVQPAGYSVSQVALLILGYESLALVGCLAAVGFLWGGSEGQGTTLLVAFFALGLVWSIVRPSRSPADVLWAVFPMTLLASKGISWTWRAFASARSRWASRGQVLVSLALGVFAWQSFAGHAALGGQVPDSSAALRLGVGVVAILAMVVIGGLVATSWNESLGVGAAGLGLAVGILLAVGQVSAAANLAGDRRSEANELWWPSAPSGQLSVLVRNLQQISEWQTGTPQDLPVVVSGDLGGALGWALQSFPKTSNVPLGQGASPTVFLSLESAGNQELPPFPASYMGEPFSVQTYRAWSDFPPDGLAWWLDRAGPTRAERVILWVRQDVQNPGAGKG